MRLADLLSQQILTHWNLAPRPEVLVGYLSDIPAGRLFDSILYIDVLEHIENDRRELEIASRYLRPSGALAVLCPAHNFLFTEFDRAIGHHRRYNRQTLQAVGPEGLQLRSLFYLDSFGMLLSIANRYILGSSSPTSRQIRIWDKEFVPVSRFLDPIINWRLGKTVVAIWER